MKSSLTIILIILSTIGKSQTSGEVLRNAYKKKSPPLLISFFETWKQEIQPITNDEFSSFTDTLKYTYNIFTDFYKPLRIDSLGGSEYGDELYNNVSYLLVQNSIKILFTDKVYYNEQEVNDYIIDHINKVAKSDSIRSKLLNMRTNGKFYPPIIDLFGPFDDYVARKQNEILVSEILDFRPNIDCPSKSCLYISQKYNDLLNNFLGNEHLAIGEEGIMNPSSPSGESEKRKEFLETLIRINYGHWGGRWDLISCPEANSITFDKEMNYARIDFSIIHEHGEVYYKRQDSKWVRIFTRKTWIE